jgi:uncharacterized protein
VDPLDGTGIRWLPVPHAGNDVASEQEAAELVRLLGALFDPAAEARWTTSDGDTRPLAPSDVVVVAP